MMGDVGSKESFSEFARPFGIGFGQNYTSIREHVKAHIEGKDLLPKVRDYDDAGFESHSRSLQERESATYGLAGFIASVPLNSHTASLQKSLLERLEGEIGLDGSASSAKPKRPKKKEPGIRDLVNGARARRLYFLCNEYKQRRSIDELIRRKGKLGSMEIASEKALDVDDELSYFRDFILEVPMGCGEDCD
jgi:hypothetical protein